MVEDSFPIPVYRNWPEKQYQVLGSIRWGNPRQYWDDGIIRQAAEFAKKQGADAIIIRRGTEFGVSSMVGWAESPAEWGQDQTTALAVRWKSEEALAKEAAILAAFNREFRDKNPRLVENVDLLEFGTDYIRWLGLELDSPEAGEKLRKILAETQSERHEGLNGKWLWKATYRKAAITSSSSGIVYGIASATVNGDSLNLLSTSKGAELNFSGTHSNGSISGRLGIGTIALSKCDGVAAGDKISLTAQGQSDDGTLQASVIFQR
jgi:hypothetical protein